MYHLNVYRGPAWPTDCHRISHLTLEMPLRGMHYYPYCTDEDTGSERWVTRPRSHSKPVVELEQRERKSPSHVHQEAAEHMGSGARLNQFKSVLCDVGE